MDTNKAKRSKAAATRAKAGAGRGKKPKIFVLDTNVLLHDHKSIYKFQENDLVLPLTVLEELDKFKKGNEQINYNAREIMRTIDKLSGNGLFDKAISLGKGLGTIRVVMSKGIPAEMKAALTEDKPDHRIISVALQIKKENPDRLVILVSKDVNLRMKAKVFGLPADDYLFDKSSEETGFERRRLKSVRVPESVLAELFEAGSLSVQDIKAKPGLNEYFNLVAGTAEAPVVYRAATKRVEYVKKQYVSGIEPRNDEQAFALDALMDKRIPVVALTGMAGTGKTLLALAAAVAQAKDYKSILISRPVIPLQNQDMGFLPGDVNEKLAPYMLPLFDNLAVLKNKTKISPREYKDIEEMQKSGALQISPLAYIRGRSLSDTFFIVDEAQNLTPHEIKTIITRAAEGTKIVFTGDIYQIDSPYLDAMSNGLTYLGDHLYDQPLFAQVRLVKGERSAVAEMAGRLL
ncbi:MAG: PhoH family protein [Bacteroidales bacterium]|nr:PhoH family protein [Bacteroidales bacterium]